MARRKGRGRLSSIDLLPPEATPAVQWAVDELVANGRPQAEILPVFNERLAAVGCGPISPSAFNRHSLRIAALTRRMKESEDVTRAITDRLGPDAGDKLTVALSVLLKQAILETQEKGIGDPESLMMLGRAMQSVVSAQKTSADVRRAAQAEVDAKLRKAAAAIEKVGGEKGLTRETVEAIKERVLGVKRPVPGARDVP